MNKNPNVQKQYFINEIYTDVNWVIYYYLVSIFSIGNPIFRNLFSSSAYRRIPFSVAWFTKAIRFSS